MKKKYEGQVCFSSVVRFEINVSRGFLSELFQTYSTFWKKTVRRLVCFWGIIGENLLKKGKRIFKKKNKNWWKTSKNFSGNSPSKKASSSWPWGWFEPGISLLPIHGWKRTFVLRKQSKMQICSERRLSAQIACVLCKQPTTHLQSLSRQITDKKATWGSDFPSLISIDWNY